MDIDFKLLTVFEEIFRTRSVSAAAENLGVSQPTVSIALGKLRRYFNDPLFVRTSAGMEPTPRAAELGGPVAEALDRLKRALSAQIVFDARTSSHGFRVCMTDISQTVILPRLLSHLGTIAPDVRIDVLHIGRDIVTMLESGEADLAIGFVPQLEGGFRQQRLFAQRFVCAVRSDHPRIGKTLTIAQFERERHIQVAPRGTGHSVVDRVLQQRKIRRRIALRLPNFLGIASVIAGSDMIVMVPERLAESIAGVGRVRSVDPPVALPTYSVKQHWHERYHNDPRNRWLRGVVAELFLDRGPARKTER